MHPGQASTAPPPSPLPSGPGSGACAAALPALQALWGREGCQCNTHSFRQNRADVARAEQPPTLAVNLPSGD
jgi:hypothetical protein